MATNRSRARQFLEEIQKDCLRERYGDDYERKFREELKSSAPMSIEDYLKVFPNMPKKEMKNLKAAIGQSNKRANSGTKYEVPANYNVLKTIFDKVQATANRINFTTSKLPVIGTALSQEYNAFACKVPGTTDFLIVFESELITLCNLLAKIVIQALPEFQEKNGRIGFSFLKEKVVSHIENNLELQLRFEDLVINGMYHGQPNKTKKYFLDEFFVRFHYNLLYSLETFVVGHEYSHIALNHLKDANQTTHIRGNLNIEVILPDWQMEFEADEGGLSLLLSSVGSENLSPFCYLGPELFFTFLDLAARAKSLLSSGVERFSKGSITHPPPAQRRERIRQILKKNLPKDELDAYTILSVLFEDVLEFLWETFKKGLEK